MGATNRITQAGKIAFWILLIIILFELALMAILHFNKSYAQKKESSLLLKLLPHIVFFSILSFVVIDGIITNSGVIGRLIGITGVSLIYPPLWISGVLVAFFSMKRGYFLGALLLISILVSLYLEYEDLQTAHRIGYAFKPSITDFIMYILPSFIIAYILNTIAIVLKHRVRHKKPPTQKITSANK